MEGGERVPNGNNRGPEVRPPGEIVRRPEPSRGPEQPPGLIPPERQGDDPRRIEDIRQELGGAETPTARKGIPRDERDPVLFGDFIDHEQNEDGRIMLSEEEMADVILKVDEHKLRTDRSLPSILTGSPTATEYDSKATTFSTRTTIIEVNGKKIFVVRNYPLSFIHKGMDTAYKKLSGLHMAKARSGKWKERIEEKSEIPVIDYPDKDVVLMPYVDNINAYDAFANNHDIKNFGNCEWARDMHMDGKIELARSIAIELGRVHSTGKTWGEISLPNIIITPDRRPILVDAETEYDPHVPLLERKARDLRDTLLSVAGAVHKSEGVADYSAIVKAMLDAYPSDEVVEELQGMDDKAGLIAPVIRRFYDTARLSIGVRERPKVFAAIESYERSERPEAA